MRQLKWSIDWSDGFGGVWVLWVAAGSRAWVAGGRFIFEPSPVKGSSASFLILEPNYINQVKKKEQVGSIDPIL